MVGFGNGIIRMLRAQSSEEDEEVGEGYEHKEEADHKTNTFQSALTDVQMFQESTKAINEIQFSPDGLYMASSDKSNCVALYRFYHRDEDTSKPMEWIHVGKYRSHYKDIVAVRFSPGLSGGAPRSFSRRNTPLTGGRGHEQKDSLSTSGKFIEKEFGYKPLDPRPPSSRSRPSSSRQGSTISPSATPRLFSIGQDGIMQEYDVGSSSIRKGLLLQNTTRVDKVAVPIGMTPLVSTDGRQIVIATVNTEFKIKLWHENFDGQGWRCVKTSLAPTYGNPPCSFVAVGEEARDPLAHSPYIAYRTDNKVRKK